MAEPLQVSGIFIKQKLPYQKSARNIIPKLYFFHGTGGTISRGGGKYHRFLESMPEQTVFGTVKITVQGESVAQLFGNPMTAKYDLNALFVWNSKTYYSK